MPLTPKQILDKEFNKKFKGYDTEEVDVFLDEVIKDFDAIIKDKEALQTEKDEIEKKYNAIKERIEKLDLAEERVMNTVLAAQRNAQMYISKIEVQAQGIMEAATKNAKSIIEGAQIKMENARTELMKYEQLLNEYKQRFRAFLDEQYNIMDNKVEEVEITKSVAEISKYINKLTMDMTDIDETYQKLNVEDILKSKDMDMAEEEPIPFKKSEEIKILVDELGEE
jgi:cell division initiation protein